MNYKLNCKDVKYLLSNVVWVQKNFCKDVKNLLNVVCVKNELLKR